MDVGQASERHYRSEPFRQATFSVIFLILPVAVVAYLIVAVPDDRRTPTGELLRSGGFLLGAAGGTALAVTAFVLLCHRTVAVTDETITLRQPLRRPQVLDRGAVDVSHTTFTMSFNPPMSTPWRRRALVIDQDGVRRFHRCHSFGRRQFGALLNDVNPVPAGSVNSPAVPNPAVHNPVPADPAMTDPAFLRGYRSPAHGRLIVGGRVAPVPATFTIAGVRPSRARVVAVVLVAVLAGVVIGRIPILLDFDERATRYTFQITAVAVAVLLLVVAAGIGLRALRWWRIAEPVTIASHGLRLAAEELPWSAIESLRISHPADTLGWRVLHVLGRDGRQRRVRLGRPAANGGLTPHVPDYDTMVRTLAAHCGPGGLRFAYA